MNWPAGGLGGAPQNQPERPDIPDGYGISSDPHGLLTWDVVDGVMTSCDLYWVATTSPEGRPHLIPIHAAYADQRVYLSGDPDTRWYRNLSARPRIEVGAASGNLQVMFRGRAELITPDESTFAAISANISSKYDWEAPHGPTWQVTPSVVIAFDVADFANSPTRFRFTEES
ncbi:MAG: pyridoxamine 5'-phosphate oxidase family protein [Acidimicrobiia bacterium]